MKTRDRILECALQLFNQKGEPNVSTMEAVSYTHLTLPTILRV